MNIKSLQSSFKNKQLFEQAFIHRSYLNENRKNTLKSNERLEFLGDAVLELATSLYLFKKYPKKPEGELTALRSALVKTETLAQVASDLKLGINLKMSRGEARSGGQTNSSLLANTTEAVIGAIYLDQGFEAASKFISYHVFPHLKQILKLGLYKDFKSTLQETIQSKGHPTPEYKTISSSGPDHHKTFKVKVLVEDKTLATGIGPSKQKAQQDAAKNALSQSKPNLVK